jgi:hypothetical protein
MIHVSSIRHCRRPSASLASPGPRGVPVKQKRGALPRPPGATLCRLSATGPWFWLVRSGAPGGLAAKIIQAGAHATKTAPALSLVLLHELPRLLVAIGEGATGHG